MVHDDSIRGLAQQYYHGVLPSTGEFIEDRGKFLS
jgi:hypothetical protein